MSLAAVLAEPLQRRRLLLAAAALELFPARPRHRSSSSRPQPAQATDLRRAGYVLGHASAPNVSAGSTIVAPLPIPHAGVDAPASLRAWRDPAAVSALQVRAAQIAAAWFAAGWRLMSVPELTDERDAVLPLTDATPPLLWACSCAWTDPATLDSLIHCPRLAALHSRKPRDLHGGLEWIRMTPAALHRWRQAQPEGAPAPLWIGGRDARWEQLLRAAADAAQWPCIDVLNTSLLATNADPDGFRPALLTLSLVWPGVASTPSADAESIPVAPDLRLRRDDLILALATAALAIDLRAGGNWYQRLTVALDPAAVPLSAGDTRRDRIWVVTRTAQATPTAKSAPSAAAELCARGARPLPVVLAPLPSALSAPAPAPAPHGGWPIVPHLAVEADWPYLAHWTRRPSGPWPDETPAVWLARLLAAPQRPAAAAGDALARIAAQRTIFGGSQFLRHGPAVCFTGHTPDWLRRLPPDRRRHRGLNRPLYEPFGIALRREFLLEAGVAPAIYGDEAVYADLAPDDRFRFQLNAPAATAAAGIDPWSREDEWRLPGDLDFSAADPVDYFLIVPDAAAAGRLAAELSDPTVRIAILP